MINNINDVKPENIPHIDLYIDQVVELFKSSDPCELEKNLTKTMINNYSKTKVLKPIKGRKYPFAHVVIIAIINRLKPTMALSDIKSLLALADDELMDENGNYLADAVVQVYKSYLEIMNTAGMDSQLLEELLNKEKNKISEAKYKIVSALCYCNIAQKYILMAQSQVDIANQG